MGPAGIQSVSSFVSTRLQFGLFVVLILPCRSLLCCVDVLPGSGSSSVGLVVGGSRHGNNAFGFHRHRIQNSYGSSICVFHANPEFQLKGNIRHWPHPVVDLPFLLLISNVSHIDDKDA